jgi:hypothetical protein
MRVIFPFCLAILIATDLTIAAVPAAVMEDISKPRISQTFNSVSMMPPPLKRALADVFNQRTLELANPSAKLRGTSLITEKNGRLPPMRRLRFAFETDRHYVVYYELGHPWRAASALVFSKNERGGVKFLWGGADIDPNYARNPQELASRIRQHKLRDDLRFVW